MDTIDINGQGIECFHESWHNTRIGVVQWQDPGAALGQHLPDVFPEFLPPLAAFGHLLPEVLPIENQTIKKKRRPDVATAIPALIPSDSTRRDTAAGRALLKGNGWIEPGSARLASAFALREHGQRTVALGTVMAEQHDTVEESAGLLYEGLDDFIHFKSQGYDPHRLHSPARKSIGLGVRLEPARSALLMLQPRTEPTPGSSV